MTHFRMVALGDLVSWASGGGCECEVGGGVRGLSSVRGGGVYNYINNKSVNKYQYHEILVLIPHTYLYYMDRGTCTFIVGALVGGLHSHALTLTRFLKRACH